MNILLTGGTGFLGSHLLVYLAQKGHRVVALKKRFSKISIPDGLEKQILVRSTDDISLEHIFSNEMIEVVIHVATVYGKKNETLDELLQCNVLLPVKLMELSLRHGVKCFVNTDTFYGKNRRIYPPLLQYSISKIQCLQWLRKLAGPIQVVNFRLEHLYGPGDDDSKFIPSIIRQMLLDRAGEISLTSGIQERDFIFIDDLVAAYSALLDNIKGLPPTYSEIEVGTGQIYSIKALVNMIRTLLSPVNVRCVFGSKPLPKKEIMRSRAKSGILQKTGWRPAYTLREGLLKTITSMRNEKIQ